MTTEVDGLHICPYNKSHMVEWHRLPNHLVRCRKNNPSLKDTVQICPYNQCHHVHKDEMELHLQSCRDHHTFKAVSVKPAPCESLPNSLMQRVREEEEHLRYIAHRNTFASPPSTGSSSGVQTMDAYARKQHQKNIDDLDEWFVE